MAALRLPGPLSGMVRVNVMLVNSSLEGPETCGIFTQVGWAQASRSKSAPVRAVMQSCKGGDAGVDGVAQHDVPHAPFSRPSR